MSYLEHNLLESLTPGTFKGLHQLQWLMMSSNRLRRLLPGVLDHLNHLQILNLTHNNLTVEKGDRLYVPRHLDNLILRNNDISYLSGDVLTRCNGIKTVNLADNYISTIEAEAFSPVTDLVHLDLKNNQLEGLAEDALKHNLQLKKFSVENNPITMSNITAVLKHVPTLTSLNLKGVIMRDPSIQTFDYMENLTYVYFGSYRMCRYAPKAQVCEPKDDGISTVQNMLEHPVHRRFIWAVAIVTILSNVLVIVCRSCWKQETDVHVFFIQNLCAADLMTGFYLLIIATYDVIFRGQYNRHSIWWISSWACKTVGILAVMATEVSVLILAAMSCERFITIYAPFRDHNQDKKRTRVAIATIWLFGMFMAILPLLDQGIFGHFYSTNAVCLPLFLDYPHGSGWQYSAFIYLGLNLFALVLVCCFYLALYYYVRKNVGTCGGSGVDHTQLTKRLLVIIFTHFLCLVPVMVCKIMALSNIPIAPNLYASITVFALPVNSVANPVVYTVTTPAFWRRLKSFMPKTGLSKPGTPQSPTSCTLTSRLDTTAFEFSHLYKTSP